MATNLVSLFLSAVSMGLGLIVGALRIISVFIMAQGNIKLAIRELTADYANEVIMRRHIKAHGLMWAPDIML